MAIFNKKYRPQFITSKSAFIITLIVISLTITIVWLQGLHLERSILRNSILSTSLLSGILFLFLTLGLYQGYKLKENVGKIVDQFELNSDGIRMDWMPDNPLDITIGDGIEGIIASIIIWFVATLVFGILFFLFSTIIWFSILLLLAILYWIFFRGLRLIFKKSPICQGNFLLSVRYAGLYTFFAITWLLILLFILENQNYSIVAFGALFN